jgi:putative glutathione S-transferase
MTSFVVRDALQEVDTTGKFTRVASSFREIISMKHPTFQPEFGRYHLYISLACPWANRALGKISLVSILILI